MTEGIVFEYFVRPIMDSSVPGYNMINTLAYVMLLLIISFGIIYPILNKKGIKFNQKFATALIPYILFGISMRVIMSMIESEKIAIAGIVKTANPLEIGYWFFTPGIWFFTTAIVILGLIIGKIAQKKNIGFNRSVATVGVIAMAIPLSYVINQFQNWAVFLLSLGAIVGVIGLFTAILKKIFEKVKYDFTKDKMNVLALAGQAIDGTSTAIAITFFGFQEMHPVSNAILEINPILFVIVKIFLIALILYIIDKEIEDENTKGFLKIILIILGFATGTASLFKMPIFIPF